MRVKTTGRSSQDKKLQGTERDPQGWSLGEGGPKNELERQVRGGQVSQNSGLRRDWRGDGWRSGAGHHQDPDDGMEKEMNL